MGAAFEALEEIVSGRSGSKETGGGKETGGNKETNGEKEKGNAQGVRQAWNGPAKGCAEKSQEEVTGTGEQIKAEQARLRVETLAL